MKKRKRRILNELLTVEKYVARVLSSSAAELAVLNGYYLSSFNIYNNIRSVHKCSLRLHQLPILQLMKALRAKGINILGCTSERKVNGVYICATLLDGEPRASANVMYCGAYNYFTNSRPHPIFSIQRSDHVYNSHVKVDKK